MNGNITHNVANVFLAVLNYICELLFTHTTFLLYVHHWYKKFDLKIHTVQSLNQIFLIIQYQLWFQCYFWCHPIIYFSNGFIRLKTKISEDVGHIDNKYFCVYFTFGDNIKLSTCLQTQAVWLLEGYIIQYHVLESDSDLLARKLAWVV